MIFIDYEDKSLEEAIKTILKHDSDCKVITIFYRKELHDAIVKCPNVIRKGRWYYYKHKGKLIYLKEVKITLPEGFETVGYKKVHLEECPVRLNEEQVKQLTTKKADFNKVGNAEIEWSVFEWKN